jgi:hypothetical protein
MKSLLMCLVMTAWCACPVQAQSEIAYDDGTAERSRVWNAPGNGVAVRFSVDAGSVLVGARFFIVSAPFWNPLGICILSANGSDGAPGDTLLSYFEEPLDSWSGFHDVTFPAPILLPIPEFYVVYLQTRWGDGDSNTVGVDTSGAPDGRSWLFQNSAWALMPLEDGDVMIRAVVAPPTAIFPSTWGRIKSLYMASLQAGVLEVPVARFVGPYVISGRVGARRFGSRGVAMHRQ